MGARITDAKVGAVFTNGFHKEEKQFPKSGMMLLVMFLLAEAIISTVNLGSGVNTTITDLIKWEENFFSRRFSGENFYQLMHRTQHFENGWDSQAFGLYRGNYKCRTYWGWDGGDYGVSAQIMRFPKEQVAIIVLSNIGTGNSAEKAEKIANKLIKAHAFERSLFP